MRAEHHHILPASRETPLAPSFPLRHRLYRALFIVAWTLLARWTPPPFHRWRAVLVRTFGARIAPGARIHASARIWYPANLVMEAGTILGPTAICYNIAPITIGAGATVSQGAHLCTGTHDIADPSFQLRAAPILIGEKAWVAAQAFVGPGVELGQGAVLGARAVTFSDLDPWTVHAGNPARYLKARPPM